MRKRYDFNEYEMLYLIHGKNELAYELMEKKARIIAKSLIKVHMAKLNVYFRTEDERADLIAYCMLVYDHAIYRYQESAEVVFTVFLKQCMIRQIMTYFRTYRTLAGQMNRKLLSLDNMVMESEEVAYVDTIASQCMEYDPVKQLEVNLLKAELGEMMKQLKPLEAKILHLRLKHYSFDEIGMMLQMSPSVVRYTVRKIKKILKGRID